jgi:iron only hydrogenase large subunit-like protein
MDRDGLEAKRDQAFDEIAEMERAVRGVEASLREHGQQSAVSGGRINVAYQRKKKRLDEEMEALLVGIEEKRKGVEALEHELEDCSERQRSKEDLLKALERQLVEVLVDQQKRLLRTLTEAGQEHAKYAKDKEKLKLVS